jgi:primosomal protein N' (replication factor Y)
MRLEIEREGRAHLLSRELVQAIRDRLAQGEQTMLLLNRRGFATSLVCPKCGEVARCADCSVAVTFHKKLGRLVCHLCGASRPVPDRCPNAQCRDPAFRLAGAGTERIEEALGRVFPSARVARMDSDSMTRRDDYRRVLGDFRIGRIDILVGTQMIAKGLHFPNVTLVGVVNADTGLHVADFRAGERTFQLLTQVAGRAGRGEVPGEVIVQTFTPFHPAVQAARRMDFEGFCDQELAFRRELGYPPYTRLVCCTLRGRDEAEVARHAGRLAEGLRPLLPPSARLSDPAPAPIQRIKGFFRHQVLLRGPSPRALVAALRTATSALRLPKGVVLAVDVDAVSLF